MESHMCVKVTYINKSPAGQGPINNLIRQSNPQFIGFTETKVIIMRPDSDLEFLKDRLEVLLNWKIISLVVL